MNALNIETDATCLEFSRFYTILGFARVARRNKMPNFMRLVHFLSARLSSLAAVAEETAL